MMLETLELKKLGAAKEDDFQENDPYVQLMLLRVRRRVRAADRQQHRSRSVCGKIGPQQMGGSPSP